MAYVDDIVAALGNTRPNTKKYAEIIAKEVAKDKQQGYAFAIPTPAPEDTSRYAKIIAREAAKDRPQVVVTDESYAPNGLLYTRFPEPSREQEVVEDILVPGKPNIDWNEPQGVSYAGGFGLGDSESDSGSVSIPVANDAISASADAASRNAPVASGEMPAVVSPSAATAFAGDEMNLSPARQRRSNFARGMMGVADLLQISASRPNLFGQSALQPGSAYLGMTEDAANKYDKIRMEEDPEGYTIDLNRAKVLSQKALTEEDPARKAIYGREIKKLLPRETEGLDDLTASEFFTAGADSKLKLEQLKGYNKLQQIQLQNSGKMDLQQLKNASSEDIAQLKANTQWDIASLNNEYKKAIADGNNERAITVAQMVTDRQKDLADINNAVKLKQTQMQQEGANYRTGLQQSGAMARTQAQQAGALERTKLQQAGALERAKASAAGKANGDAGMAQGFKESIRPEMLEKMKELNKNAGRWDYMGSEDGLNLWQRALGDTYATSVQKGEKRAQNFQEFQAYAQQIVNSQLKKILGGQFTEAEGERVLSSFGINPRMAPDVRWRAFINGMNNLAAKYGIEDRIPLDGDQTKKTTGTSKIKSVKRIG